MKRLKLNNSEGIANTIRSYFEKNEEAKLIHRLHGILLFANKKMKVVIASEFYTANGWMNLKSKEGHFFRLSICFINRSK